MTALAQAVVAERVHDPAIGDLTTPALLDHAPQFTSKLLQLRDLPLNGLEMTAGDAIGLTAITTGIFPQGQQRADVGDVEPESASVADECQPLLVAGAVIAVIPVRPSRLGQESDALIIADGLGLRAGCLGELSNLHEGAVYLVGPTRSTQQRQGKARAPLDPIAATMTIYPSPRFEGDANGL